MTAISERYAKRAAEFDAKVVAVSELSAINPDVWERPSPNPGWDARGVVAHVVETSSFCTAGIDSITGELDVAKDPLAAWRTACQGVQNALETPELATQEVDAFGSKISREQLADMYLSFDLVVHAWDLARAAGVDETLNAELVNEVRKEAEGMVEVGRQMGAFGPEVEVADNASEQDQLLGMLGRKP